MNLVWKLLRKHISIIQLGGFFVANLIGLGIILCGVQIYNDVKPLLSGENSLLAGDNIVIAKQVLSMENIIELSERQKKTYTIPVAYDYFCCELENMLYYVFGLSESVAKIGVTATHEKTLLRSVIIAAAHIIYLDRCLAYQTKELPAE